MRLEAPFRLLFSHLNYNRFLLSSLASFSSPPLSNMYCSSTCFAKSGGLLRRCKNCQHSGRHWAFHTLSACVKDIKGVRCPTRARATPLRIPFSAAQPCNESRAAPARGPPGGLRTFPQSKTQQRTPAPFLSGQGFGRPVRGSAGRRHCRPNGRRRACGCAGSPCIRRRG